MGDGDEANVTVVPKKSEPPKGVQKAMAAAAAIRKAKEAEESSQEDKTFPFEIEVVSYKGLKLPGTTTVEISGFCDSPLVSDELHTTDEEPKWLFEGANTTECLKVLSYGPNLNTALVEEMTSKQLVFTISNSLDKQVFGIAKFTLEGLIHDSTSVSMVAEVEWGPEFLEHWMAEHKAAKEAEREKAAAEEGAAPFEEHDETPTPEPGTLVITVTVDQPPGRLLAPMDYDDWVVLTIKNEGVFSLPTKLVDLNPSPIADAPPGHIADHPLTYSVRVLGCAFDGGKIVKPDFEDTVAEGGPSMDGVVSPKPQGSVEEAPGTEGDESGGRERAGTMGSAHEGSVSAASAKATQQSVGVSYEKFVDGLTRVGYPNSHEDGPQLWKLLNKANNPTLNLSDWVELGNKGVPADEGAVLSFREWLLDKFTTLQDAFEAMDSESKGSITEEEFLKALVDLEYEKTDGPQLFKTLDINGEDFVTWEDFQCLHLFKALEIVGKVGTLKKWLINNVGRMMKCMQVIDDNASGRVSFDEWTGAMERLKYPEPEDANVAFYFMDLEISGIIGPKNFAFLEKFDSKAFIKEMAHFQQFLKAKFGNMDVCFQDFAFGDGSNDTITPKKWHKAMKRVGYKSPSGVDNRVFFNFLDESHSGVLSKSEFLLLRAFNSSAAKGGLARIKSFFTSRFAELSDAYNIMFGDPTEFFHTAEKKMPHIQFDTSEVRSYRGRPWLQKILNTIGDDRGRKLAKNEESVIGGSWAYFFPKLINVDEKVREEKGGLGGILDYKDAPAPDLENARSARWHHAQTFVDLRQMQEDSTCNELELRCFLSQVGPMPKDITEGGGSELPKGPFESCRTYVKLTVSFDRQIENLCPRGIPNLPERSGTPFIPGAPEAKPPPTVLEEFEMQVRDVVGKLTEKFALQCLHQGLEQPQIVGPRNKVSQYALLGKGLDRGQFLLWLRSAQQGKLWEDLATALRPAAVKVIRECAADGPASGLYGDDKDAKYSELRDLFMTHIMKAINTDINLQGFRREAKTWKNPPLWGDGDENFFEPDDLAIQEKHEDKKLQRLAFECEMYGEFERANRMWGERLALPMIKENFDVWVQYARFLMRTQRRQPEAEEALRYAISLVSLEEADTNALLFLACIMMNRSLPCSLANEPRSLRFNVALKLLTIVLEKNPTDRAANFFMYLMFAVEAKEESDPKLASVHAATSSKYLDLSKADDPVFNGTLPSLDEDGDPYFPELEDLVKRELTNRSGGKQEVQEMEIPLAWMTAKFDAIPTLKEVHLMPQKKDEVALDAIDRLLLFGMPIFSRYLLFEAAEAHGFITKTSLESERCQLQQVKTLMMLGEYEEAIKSCENLLGLCDRLCEAYLLLGECYYRAAMNAPLEKQKEMYDTSLQKFEDSMAFLPAPPKEEGEKKHHKDDVEVTNKDPILHLRVASIYYMRAEESGWKDLEILDLAKEHYKRSLLLSQTAEAWRNSGVCAYRMACIKAKQGLHEEEDMLFEEALECLKQSNLMDTTRPKINSWLTICAVQLGKNTIAQQAFRQTMAMEAELDFDAAMELAQALLHFSDPKNAEAEGGFGFVRPGLYAREALIAAKAALMKKDSGEAHFIIAQAHMMLGEDKEAMVELRGAIAWFYDQPERQQVVAEVARTCAARIIDEPRMMEVVDEDLQMATERRKVEAAAAQ